MDHIEKSDNMVSFYPFQLTAVAFVLVCLVLLSVIELFLQKACQVETPTDLVNTGTALLKKSKLTEPLSLLFAFIGFSVPIILCFRNSFERSAFCIMNVEEPICEEILSEIDCFELALKPNSSIIGYKSSYSGYLKIGWFFNYLTFTEPVSFLFHF